MFRFIGEIVGHTESETYMAYKHYRDISGKNRKRSQQILRHANVSTTATYYIKTVPAQVTDAMKKLQQAIPETLSGNEVATHTMNATAAPVVN